jgi:hypothetical protein
MRPMAGRSLDIDGLHAAAFNFDDDDGFHIWFYAGRR